MLIDAFVLMTASKSEGNTNCFIMKAFNQHTRKYAKTTIWYQGQRSSVLSSLRYDKILIIM